MDHEHLEYRDVDTVEEMTIFLGVTADLAERNKKLVKLLSVLELRRGYDGDVDLEGGGDKVNPDSVFEHWIRIEGIAQDSSLSIASGLYDLLKAELQIHPNSVALKAKELQRYLVASQRGPLFSRVAVRGDTINISGLTLGQFIPYCKDKKLLSMLIRQEDIPYTLDLLRDSLQMTPGLVRVTIPRFYAHFYKTNRAITVLIIDIGTSDGEGNPKMVESVYKKDSIEGGKDELRGFVVDALGKKVSELASQKIDLSGIEGAQIRVCVELGDYDSGLEQLGDNKNYHGMLATVRTQAHDGFETGEVNFRRGMPLAGKELLVLGQVECFEWKVRDSDLQECDFKDGNGNSIRVSFVTKTSIYAEPDVKVELRPRKFYLQPGDAVPEFVRADIDFSALRLPEKNLTLQIVPIRPKGNVGEYILYSDFEEPIVMQGLEEFGKGIHFLEGQFGVAVIQGIHLVDSDMINAHVDPVNPEIVAIHDEYLLHSIYNPYDTAVHESVHSLDDLFHLSSHPAVLANSDLSSDRYRRQLSESFFLGTFGGHAQKDVQEFLASFLAGLLLHPHLQAKLSSEGFAQYLEEYQETARVILQAIRENDFYKNVKHPLPIEEKLEWVVKFSQKK